MGLVLSSHEGTQAEHDERSAQRMGSSYETIGHACVMRINASAQSVTQVAQGYQPRPMSQKNAQPEPSSSPSTRQVIITLPAWRNARHIG